MASISLNFWNALSLLLQLDRELLGIILLSLRVSGTALLLATSFALPVGAIFAFKEFPLKGTLISGLQTLMGLPPVVAGLFLYLLLSRSGPLGFLALLYTPSAMIAAQSILAFPIIASLSHSAIIGVDPIIKKAALSLGATPLQVSLVVMKEARYGIISGIIAGFGRVIAEVGAILIVGGNIAGYTRVMTTTIALETDKGNFELALALGLLLLLISLVINFAMHAIQRRGTVSTDR